MRRRSLFIVAAFIAIASAASADPPDGHQPVGIGERPSVGLLLGTSKNGDPERGGGTGGEIDFVFDTPVSRSHRVRFDATRTSWNAVSDTITLDTVRVSLVSVRHESPHVASYGAIGLGAYRYDYARTPPAHHWHGGVSYVFGLEFLRHGEHSAVNAEVRLHAMGGPTARPETQVLMFKFDGAIGMKLRF